VYFCIRAKKKYYQNLYSSLLYSYFLFILVPIFLPDLILLMSDGEVDADGDVNLHVEQQGSEEIQG
jgi:hypothetical protein